MAAAAAVPKDLLRSSLAAGAALGMGLGGPVGTAEGNVGRLSRGLQGLAKEARLKVFAAWNATSLSDSVFGQYVV